ncbi:hypothetical protein JZ751_024360 [Albula glossodonta]|uniref:Uncharacterized protein n=1 Tax=Albula glossodonta TaxID=121402 RepID=A0A8T2NGV7_9TELE|nr:hypothetical protein JZ751_024360 [Albula glossodonta]
MKVKTWLQVLDDRDNPRRGEQANRAGVCLGRSSQSRRVLGWSSQECVHSQGVVLFQRHGHMTALPPDVAAALCAQI